VVPPLLSLSDAEHSVFTMIDGMMIVTTFMVVVTHGNHPPDLLAAGVSSTFMGRLYVRFLRSAAHECVLQTQLPLRTLTVFGSLLAVACILFSLNAGNNFVVVYLQEYQRDYELSTEECQY